MAHHRLRALAASAILGVLAVTASGCAPPPSYSSLDDDAMKKLFPTETEIKTALGNINTVTGPKSQVNNPSASPQPSNGLSPECYDAAYGGFSQPQPSRLFVMQSSGSGGPSFTWVLAQRSSADDIRKTQDNLRDRLSKCDSYELFDSGTSSGTSFVTKPSPGGKPGEGANVIVTSGDVSLAFAVSGTGFEKAKELARKMAPVMEKRLQASAPKS